MFQVRTRRGERQQRHTHNRRHIDTGAEQQQHVPTEPGVSSGRYDGELPLGQRAASPQGEHQVLDLPGCERDKTKVNRVREKG